MITRCQIFTVLGVWCYLVCMTLGASYINKCYCPGVDPLINSDRALRNKMYILKTGYTNTLNISYTRVVPNTGVPPADILTMMFPDVDNSTFNKMTVSEYNATFNAVQAAIQQRINNLNSSAIARGVPLVTLEIAQGSNKFFSIYTTTLLNPNMTVYLDNYTAILTPENAVYGIQAVDNALPNAENCNCGTPTYKCRKQMKYFVSYSKAMEDPASTAFVDMKTEVEKKCDALYSSSNPLLSTQGYAGTTVLGIKLLTLNAASPTSTTAAPAGRKKRQVTVSTTTTITTSAAGTTTTTLASDTSSASSTTLTTTTVATTTTTQIPRLDLVMINSEVTFAGSDTPANMQRAIDTTMNSLRGTYGIVSATNCLGATCNTDNLALIKPPAFLSTTVAAGQIIPSGFFVTYTCAQTNQMIPFTSDLDSNFQLEVYCVNGAFLPPGWPSSCEPLKVCSSVPVPPQSDPIPLVRIDSRERFRVGESAYFGCKDPAAVLNDGSGMKVFTLPCPADLNYVVTWPKCILEPVCDSYPVPPAAAGLNLATTTSSVLLGNFINYECTRRSEFYETPTGPIVQVLCDSPVSGGKGTAVAPSPWPMCAKLLCQCLGYGPNVNQTLNILQTSCDSGSSYTMKQDTNNISFILPRIVNCGTYHPSQPTAESVCECPELGTPVTFWNQLQILSYIWFDKMSDANERIFQRRKALAEQSMDTFYLNQPWMRASGYIRSQVVFFRQGSAHQTLPDTYYTRATVVLLFRADTNMSLDALASLHGNLLSTSKGIFSDSFTLVPTSTITSNITCVNVSMSRFFVNKYNISGNTRPVPVGKSVTVSCGRAIQFFTADIWDDNSTDNTLEIICKPDTYFNVPSVNQMPDCLAKCSANKPVPPADFLLDLDTNQTSATDQLWENQELWYKCRRTLDGVAVSGPNNTLEGGDSRFLRYFCDPNGNYNIPTLAGVFTFPRCLPRPRRCQCLGDFKLPAFSKTALDLYCRNQSFILANGTFVDRSSKNTLQIVPNKTRCGSLDPVELQNPDNRCYCLTKDKLGSQSAYWLRLEFLNIPWVDDFLDFKSSNFTAAKMLVEQVMDTMYIDFPESFSIGYVRSIVMRFYKGTALLNPVWTNLIQRAVNASNATIPPSSLDDLPDEMLPGYPIHPDFDPFPGAGTQRGISKTNFYSTSAEIELQFAIPKATDAGSLLGLTKDFLLITSWANNTLWVNMDCFKGATPTCRMTNINFCQGAGLSVIFGFGYTHNELTPSGAIMTEPIIGSTVNLFCSDPQKRVTVDNADDDPNDYKLTVLCQPSGGFKLPLDSNKKLPLCKAWCSAKKPVPPTESGLVIYSKDNNTREYWEGETLRYICADVQQGVEAAATEFQNYTCIYDNFNGNRYTNPMENQSWPFCMARTTTVKTPIKVAFRTVFNDFHAQLIQTENALMYNIEQSIGDKDYYLIVTVPTLIFMTIIIMICLCCTRYDNSLWSFCSSPSDVKNP